MDAKELARWRRAQVRALIDSDIDPVTAESVVDEVIARMEPGGDPNDVTWPDDPIYDAITDADIMDARSDWQVNAPDSDKLLLDAQPWPEEEEEA